MTDFLAFSVVGIVTGCIYAVAASGLVVFAGGSQFLAVALVALDAVVHIQGSGRERSVAARAPASSPTSCGR